MRIASFIQPHPPQPGRARLFRQRWGLGLSLLLLAGCGLPAAGPSTTAMLTAADAQNPPFAMVDATPKVLPLQRLVPRPSLIGTFGRGSERPDLRIAAGDLVSISLWEAPPGTLFGTPNPAGQSVNGGGTINLPSQSVGSDGTITVPYVGRIRVVGQQAADVEGRITKALEGKAIQPQALVTVLKSTFNAVTVTGEVAGGARIPLSAGGDRILDAIAAAGGLRTPVAQAVVQLTRGRQTTQIPFQTIVETPGENVYLRPGDVVTVMQQPRTYTVLGAAGRNSRMPFGTETISMAEAMAQAGGLLDDRADASGVFLLRREPVAVARHLLPSGSPLIDPIKGTPVVYRFNLADGQTMVTMNEFNIEAGDVIYISDSPSVSVQKFFNIFQSISNPALAAANVSSAVR